MLLKCPKCQSNPSPSPSCSKCHGLGIYDPTIELRIKYWQQVGLIVAMVALLVTGVIFLAFGGSGDNALIGVILSSLGLGMLLQIFASGIFPSNTRRLIRDLEAKYAQEQAPKAKSRLVLDDDAELVTLSELLDEERNSASQ